MTLNWTALGTAARESALEAHGVRDFPHVDTAFGFVVDNPELFADGGEWPAEMPPSPPMEFLLAYHEATA